MGQGRGVPLSIWILVLTFTCVQKNVHAMTMGHAPQHSSDTEEHSAVPHDDKAHTMNGDEDTQQSGDPQHNPAAHHNEEAPGMREEQGTPHSGDPEQDSVVQHGEKAPASGEQPTEQSDEPEQDPAVHHEEAPKASKEQVDEPSDAAEQESVVPPAEEAPASGEQPTEQSDEPEQDPAVHNEEAPKASKEQVDEPSDAADQESVVPPGEEAPKASKEQVDEPSDAAEQESVVPPGEEAPKASKEQVDEPSDATEQESVVPPGEEEPKASKEQVDEPSDAAVQESVVPPGEEAPKASKEEVDEPSDAAEQESVVPPGEEASKASKEQADEPSDATEQESVVPPGEEAPKASKEQVDEPSDATEQESVVPPGEEEPKASKEQVDEPSDAAVQESVVPPGEEAQATSEQQLTPQSSDSAESSVGQQDGEQSPGPHTTSPAPNKQIFRSLTTMHDDQVCSTWGNFHFKTFDGNVYHFPGTCNYVFASHCKSPFEDFNIQIRRTVEKTTNIPTLTRITVKMEDDYIVMEGGEVTLNGQEIVLPYSDRAMEIDRNGLYLTMVCKNGIFLKWNEEDALMLELNEKYKDKVCGLCGDFNHVSQDEFTSNGMNITAVQYGNLQKVNGPEEQCEDIAEEVLDLDNCIAHEDTCHTIMMGPAFADCHEEIDVQKYIGTCEKDLCRCNNESHSFCLCNTFTEYSRQCSHSGKKPLSWRTDDLCPITCPFNMFYEECGTPCVDTCSNTEQSEICEDHCTDGCYCPEGTVYDDITNTGCIKKSECPCMFNHKTYDVGTGYKTECHDCTCAGGSWDCKDLPCVGTCALEGGSHISTFDETYYNFHGDCTYVLAKDCSNKTFSVVAELRMCGKSETETCLKSITISHNGGDKTFFIKPDGTVLIDMVYAHLPFSTDGISFFEPSSSHMVVHTSYGVQLEIELVPLMQVRVRLEPHLEGTVCGLCGNFNKNPADDFMTLNGVVEGTGASFANNWKTQSDCPNVKNNHEDPCAASVENEKYAEHWCEMLTDPQGPFAEGHALLDPTIYEKNCMFDTCKGQNTEERMCASISAYVRACAAKGVFLKGWRSEICGKYSEECHSSQVYTYSADKCQATCHSVIEADPACSAKFLPVDGCVCPEGKYLDEDDHCIEASQCDCYYKGSSYAHGEFVHENKAICTCSEGKMNCIGSVAEPECVAPMVYFDCANASVSSKGSECQKSCQTFDVECYSTHCVSGCVCPDGMVLNAKGDCIQEEDCPCDHNEVYYQPGESISVSCNTCTCKDRKWKCTEKPCFGTCTVVGDGHHITFDGKRYSFNGDCQYTLAQDYCGNGNNGTFRVITENIPCGTTGTTCSKSIKVFLGGFELILHEAHIDVVERDSSDELPYQIRYMGTYMVIESKHGVVLMWDRKTSIFIKLSSDFKGKVCGLCGNFDSNGMNDFTTRSQSVGVDVLEFANSWKANPSCPDASETKDACAVKPYRKAWAQKQCSIIMGPAFNNCSSQVDPAKYYEACVGDSCACDAGGDCECFCTAVAAYAQACSEVGVCTHWRTPDVCPLFCDYYNKEGDCEWHYKPCGAPCMKTCRNPSGKCLYELPGMEGCYPKCPEDRPYFDEEKMECTASCGCYDKHGNLVRPEDKVSTEENCQSCTCTNDGFKCDYDLEACVCMYGGKKHKYNNVIYRTGDNTGNCFVATCSVNGTIHREISDCTTSPPATTFTFTTNAPTLSGTTAVPNASSTPSGSTTTKTTSSKESTSGEVTTTNEGTTTSNPETSMQMSATTKSTPTDSTAPVTSSEFPGSESATTTIPSGTESSTTTSSTSTILTGTDPTTTDSTGRIVTRMPTLPSTTSDITTTTDTTSHGSETTTTTDSTGRIVTRMPTLPSTTSDITTTTDTTSHGSETTTTTDSTGRIVTRMPTLPSTTSDITTTTDTTSHGSETTTTTDSTGRIVTRMPTLPSTTSDITTTTDTTSDGPETTTTTDSTGRIVTRMPTLPSTTSDITTTTDTTSHGSETTTTTDSTGRIVTRMPTLPSTTSDITTTTDTTSHGSETTTTTDSTGRIVTRMPTLPSTTSDITTTTDTTSHGSETTTTTDSTGRIVTRMPTNTQTTTDSTSGTSAISHVTSAGNTDSPTTTSFTPTNPHTSDGSSTTTSTGVTPQCWCTANEERFAPGEVVYNTTDEEGCPFSAICTDSCEIERSMGPCKHPTTPGDATSGTTTTSPSQSTSETSTTSPSLTSTPDPSSGVLPTTVDLPDFEIPDGCYTVNPAREVGDVWEINKCMHATCKAGGEITMHDRECPDVEKVTCESGLDPKQVFDQDGCCYHYECESCVGPDGQPRMPGESWASNCQRCTCDKESIKVQCAPMTCEESTNATCEGEGEGFELVEEVVPDNPCCTKMACKCNPLLCIPSVKNCDVGFRLSSTIEDDDCCPTVKCVPQSVCVFNNITYQPGSNIPQNKGNCKVCNCNEEMNPETQLHDVTCNDIACKTECGQGYEYTEKDDECCGECVQKACVVKTENNGTTVIEVGKSWSPNADSCSYYECDHIEDQFVTVSVKRACPLLDPEDCEEEYIEMSADGCCKVCKAPPTESCTVQKNTALLAHGECSTTVELTSCQGLCGSSSMFSSMSNDMEHKCTCCQELKTSKQEAELTCGDGSTISFSYTLVEECGCIGSLCVPSKNSEETVPEEKTKKESEEETGKEKEVETEETEKEIEKKSEQETEKEPEVETEKKLEEETEKEKVEETEETEKEIEKKSGEETEKETEKEPEVETEKKSEEATEKETEKKSEEETEKETEKKPEEEPEQETEKEPEQETEEKPEQETEKQPEEETEKEPEQETEKETEKEPEQEAENETEKEPEQEAEKEAEKEIENETEKTPEEESEKEPEQETEKEPEQETEKETEKEPEQETEKETEKEPEQETEKETEKEPEQETEKETEKEPEQEPEVETEKKSEDVSQYSDEYPEYTE